MEEIKLSEKQHNYIQDMVTEHYLTYSGYSDVSAIYLSTYRDEEGFPVVELTLVAGWFKNKNNRRGKMTMGFFNLSDPNEMEEKPLYILSMIDVREFEKCISEGCISDEDSSLLIELNACNKVLLDKDGIMDNFLSLEKGKQYSLGIKKVSYQPPIDVVS